MPAAVFSPGEGTAAGSELSESDPYPASASIFEEEEDDEEAFAVYLDSTVEAVGDAARCGRVLHGHNRIGGREVIN